MALIEGASGAGVFIEMFPKGNKRKALFCGKDQFVVQELDSEVFNQLIDGTQTLPGMDKSAMDQVKLFMKNIPNVFSH